MAEKENETINEIIRHCFTLHLRRSVFTIILNFVSKVGSGRDLDLFTKLKFMSIEAGLNMSITV